MVKINIGTRMKISDISSIYDISAINDTISAINNHLREKLPKKSVISAIYRYFIDISVDMSVVRRTRE